MDFAWTREQIEWKEKVIAFAQEHLNDDVDKRDQDQAFARELWKKSGDLKIPGLTIPQKYGGQELDPLSTALVLEGLGYGCEDGGLCFAICAHLLACVVPVWKFGSEEQKQRLLPGLCDGSLIAANAMTEPGSGSDVFNMQTLAEKQQNGFCLNGQKVFCTNAPVADVILTYALTDKNKGFFGGITAFLLEKDQHDFYSTKPMDKLGVRTSLIGNLHFNDLPVAASSVLGQPGGGGLIFSRSMEWERTLLGACHLGAMQRVLERTVRFVKKQAAMSRSFADYQAVSHQLADMKVQLEAAKLLTYRTAWKLGQGNAVAADASMAKLLVSEAFKTMMNQIVEIFAGEKYPGNPEAERLLRDALGSTIYSGTSAIQRNIIAREMGIR